MSPIFFTGLAIAGGELYTLWRQDPKSIDSRCLKLELMWRSFKFAPHYSLISRPVYKFVASKSNVVIATAASFIITDLIVHQLGLAILECYSNDNGSTCNFSWSPAFTVGWFCASLPVMYSKYKRMAT